MWLESRFLQVQSTVTRFTSSSDVIPMRTLLIPAWRKPQTPSRVACCLMSSTLPPAMMMRPISSETGITSYRPVRPLYPSVQLLQPTGWKIWRPFAISSSPKPSFFSASAGIFIGALQLLQSRRARRWAMIRLTDVAMA